MTVPRYIGRFAPTPSGYLHFGSLMAALASYLDAKAVDGLWLLRIEDLDPPREMPGAQDAIRKTLELYGFEWDGEVTRQSDRHAAYAAAVETLLENDLAYACACSRKQLAQHSVYPGHCRSRRLPTQHAAIRLRVPERIYTITDRLQGRFSQNLAHEAGDFIIRRRDGLFAYQLAVVIDDTWQGITDIVRGADLLDSTPRQRYLQELLGSPTPRYLHIPLVIQPDGYKLGKSYRSPPLPIQQAGAELTRALQALGQQPPTKLSAATPQEILAWGKAHWQAERIPAVLTLEERYL